MQGLVRFVATFILGVPVLFLVGCSPQPPSPEPAAQQGSVLEGPTPTPDASQSASAAAPREFSRLEDVCAALLPDASYDELRAVFGDGASIDEEGNLYVSAGEGLTLEPVKSAHIDDALIGFDVFGQADSGSKWTLHGLRVGDSWSAAEQANGNPFREAETGIDWDGGVFDQDRCIYSATFEMPPDMPDDASPSKYAIISGISMRWRRDTPEVSPKLQLPAPVPVEARRSFEEVCARLREDMSPEDLRKVLGAQNLREVNAETWTVFPDDPRRAFTVNFHSWEEDGPRWRIYSIYIDSPASTWALPNGVGMGDAAAVVEKAAGGPFTVWRHNVTSGGGAVLDKDNANPPITCSYHPTFRHDRALVDSNRIQSDDPDFLSWRPYVASIRVDWRWF